VTMMSRCSTLHVLTPRHPLQLPKVPTSSCQNHRNRCNRHPAVRFGPGSQSNRCHIPSI
jgi:hypothetical protein